MRQGISAREWRVSAGITQTWREFDDPVGVSYRMVLGGRQPQGRSEKHGVKTLNQQGFDSSYHSLWL
ncbi:hypothetical protein RRG08_061016 [Elysia crispata]|uniref:Uncharacterized protein n=1 Tax=Elysia crispata TaxID=231223 RepID=A0AAE1AVX1_9GAST|nr:hypothetical protein RRG08_061016 [Elysia crispata]